ncbi:hypothetical protein H5410_005448 [Solanum commersonii]|uniref:Uncharacterized protein n=1 Tax=Solanum commersonii TaxID=4109 RepID=A0A9J6A6F6_SOLCO|nr:hypothetical protein H5410_005448 [Solanum commersonii]
MKIPTLCSIIDLRNHNFYVDYIIFLKEYENIMWRKMDDLSILFNRHLASLRIPWDKKFVESLASLKILWS